MYEWDEAKARRNLEKHGVDFAKVEEFQFHGAVVRPDARKEYGEQRYVAEGYIGTRLHVLIFTIRQDRVRVISLRRANPRERKRFETAQKLH